MPMWRIVLLLSDAETPTASSQTMSVTEPAGFPGGLFRVGLNLGCLRRRCPPHLPEVARW